VRTGRLAAAALVVTVAVSGCAHAEGDPTADCRAQLAAAEAKVRTDHAWSELDLPGVGDYTSAHWQLRALGDPCSRAPGPDDWSYQGVLALQQDDAAVLAGRFPWRPVPATPGAVSPGANGLDTPARMWPALVPFVPNGVRWMHSEEYAETQSFGGRQGDVYLDTKFAVVFFVLSDR